MENFEHQMTFRPIIISTSLIFHVELYISHSLPLLLEKVLQRNKATAWNNNGQKENTYRTD
jgi:hypothetical protein